MRAIGTILISGLLLATPAAAEDAPFERLFSERADSTSFLRSNWNKYEENYHPNYVADDNPKTAWVEGAAGYGEQETLTVHVSPMPSARRVKIRVQNGYQKSKKLFKANARLADVRLELMRKGKAHSTLDTTLKDAMGWQEVIMPVAKNAGFDAVRLTIRSVQDGKRYKDTCLSELQVWVDSAVPYLADVEKAKAARLQEWIKTRVDKAAYFAKLPVSYPMVHTEFVEDDGLSVNEDQSPTAGKKGPKAIEKMREGAPPVFETKAMTTTEIERMAKLVKLRDTLAKAEGWYKLTSKARFKAPVGFKWVKGVDWLSSWGMKALRRSDFSLFEVKDRWAVKGEKMDEENVPPMFEARTHMRRAETPDGLHLLVSVKEVWHERVTTESKQDILLVYGKTGLLETAFVWGEMDDGMEASHVEASMVDFTWTDRKVDRVTVHRIRTVASYDGIEDDFLVNYYIRRVYDGIPKVAAK